MKALCLAEVLWKELSKRVITPYSVRHSCKKYFKESGCLGMQPKVGDRLLLKLNIYGKPIANKYCEGKMKRTLKRGLKDLKSLRRKQ